jgi:plastocyanin
MRGRLSTIAAGFLVAGSLGAAAPAARADCNTAASASEQHLGQGTVDVAAAGLDFAPCNVTVSTGTAVRWTITPSGAHTATADPSAPAQFNFTGGGGTFTFTAPGSYFYYCMFHGTPGAPGTGMAGVVYVQGAGGTTPPPPPPPPPPTFAGVKVVRHTVRVTRSRIAGVRVTCPAGTAGSCAGRLTLTAGVRVARRSLSIPAGETATVKLRLSRVAFRKLEKRRRLRVGLAFDVHDGNGTDSRQPNERITLKAPARR